MIITDETTKAKGQPEVHHGIRQSLGRLFRVGPHLIISNPIEEEVVRKVKARLDNLNFSDTLSLTK